MCQDKIELNTTAVDHRRCMWSVDHRCVRVAAERRCVFLMTGVWIILERNNSKWGGSFWATPPFKYVRTARQLGELLGEPPRSAHRMGGSFGASPPHSVRAKSAAWGKFWATPPLIPCEARGIGEIFGRAPH